MTRLTFRTQQDSNEDWVGDSKSCTVDVLQLCCRRSGEDSGESKTGSIYPQHSAVTRCHSNHQLHYLCSTSCPVLSVWAHWAEHVWARSNMYVLTYLSNFLFQSWNRDVHLTSPLFISYFINLLFQWMMFKSPVTESSTVCTFWEQIKASMLKGIRERFQWKHCFCLMVIFGCISIQ